MISRRSNDNQGVQNCIFQIHNKLLRYRDIYNDINLVNLRKENEY